MTPSAEHIAFLFTTLIMLAVVLRALHIWRYRERLSVLAHVGYFKIQEGLGETGAVVDGKHKHWFCKVRNAGRSDVVVCCVKAEDGKGNRHVFAGNVPSLLRPGQRTEAWLYAGDKSFMPSDIVVITERGRHRASFNRHVAAVGPVEYPH